MFRSHLHERHEPLHEYQGEQSDYRSQYEYITGLNSTLLHGLISISISNHAKLRSGYDHLLPELKQLYNILFNDKEEVILFQKILPFQQIKETPSVCNKEIKQTQISYRCFDCMHHEASMICQDCFHSANHKSHRYRQINQEGCCDCGNQRILKQQSFCRQHRQKQNEKIEIPTSKQIVFNLYITQLFVWSLKIWSTINTSLGVRFLYNFLKYLSKLNSSSPYYNELTAELLFDHKKTIMEQIIHITLTATYLKEEINNVVFELMMELTRSQLFKEKLLKVFIGMYNKTEHFQTSKFMKFMPILLSDGATIKKGMRDAVQSLNPTARSYQTMIYYQHLMMLRYLQPQTIQIFFAPLLKKEIIASPMLQLIQKRCQVRNSREMYLSTISQNTQQEFVYYRLLSMIIGATHDRNVLENMIINYSRKIDQCTFKINKIVLIPQRILTWAIFKYFDCQLTHIDFDVLQRMLSMQRGRVIKLLTNILYRVLDCLGQYALDLVRNTYFYNYRSMYIKDESQVVMIDYLAIKVLGKLFESHECGSFSKILLDYIQYSFGVGSEEMVQSQETKDKFDRFNKLIEILIEIIYSPNVEIVNCIMLSNTTKVRRQIGNLLAKIVKTRGKINQNQYSSIIKHFFFNQSIEEIVLQILSFNKQTKKYEVIYPNEVEQIRLDLIVSLIHTDLQTFLINENNSKLQLYLQQKQLRDLIFSPEIIQKILHSQFQFVQGGRIDNFAANIIELTKITYKINLLLEFQSHQCKQYLLMYRQLIDYQIEEISKQQNHSLAARINNLPTEYQKIVNNSGRQVKEDAQLKRRKELAKAKKQKMIRQRKMVQNSQLHLINHEQTLSPHKNHQLLECLICRQKSQSNKLCYFAKVKFNNIIANALGETSKHLMFYTCFHTVHLQCYLKQTSFNTKMNCPLCKLCCNIVLPHQDGSVQKLQLVRLLKNRVRQSVDHFYINSVFTEIIVFMVYLILINIENEHLTERELKLCSSLYQLLELDIQQAPKQQASFINQVTNPKVTKVIKVMYELFKQSTSAHNIQRNQFNVHDYAQQTFEQLSQLVGQFAACRIVKSMLEIIDKSVSDMFDWEIQPQPVQKLIKFIELPRDLKGLFELRDRQKCKTNINHSKGICFICGAIVCPQCKQTRQHSKKYHNKEALYFKTNTGGFLYDTSSQQLQVRSFYINELGTIWKPELQSKEFRFDDEVFEKVLMSIKHGNLFYFLTNNIEGLKGSNINDII